MSRIKMLFWPMVSAILYISAANFMFDPELYYYLLAATGLYFGFMLYLLVRSNSIYILSRNVQNIYPDDFDKLPEYSDMVFEIWKTPQSYYRKVKGFDEK